jgi:hypothetical protein
MSEGWENRSCIFLEIKTRKTAGQNLSFKESNESFENVANLKYLRSTVTN